MKRRLTHFKVFMLSLVVAWRRWWAILDAKLRHLASGKRYYVLPVDIPGRLRSFIIYGSYEMSEYNRRVKKNQRIYITEIIRNACYTTK